jgi:hypothetical protein
LGRRVEKGGGVDAVRKRVKRRAVEKEERGSRKSKGEWRRKGGEEREMRRE